MKGLFYKILENFLRVFSGRNLVWQMLAIALTWILIVSGFDWFYFVATQSSVLTLLFWPAVIVGALLPVILPVCILTIGFMRKDKSLRLVGWALAQSALLGLIIAGVYKFFTGRMHPYIGNTAIDISNSFHFGLGRYGVFWGWPSSHTTIAFAMALTLTFLFPKIKKVKYLALIYAFYIGIGVATVGIHWFSEFVAGAIIGTMIGIAVGKSFDEMKKA